MLYKKDKLSNSPQIRFESFVCLLWLLELITYRYYGTTAEVSIAEWRAITITLKMHTNQVT